MKKILSKIHHNWLRKKQKINLLSLNKPVFIHPSAKFNFQQNIELGKYSRIGPECHLDGEGGLIIGEGTILGPKVTILTSSHSYEEGNLLPYGFQDVLKPVVIGKGCWLGFGVMIVPGVTIGDGTVVAMGSVVTKSLGSGVLIGGNPAKVIKEIDRGSELGRIIESGKFYMQEIHTKSLVRKNRSSLIYKKLIIE